MKFSWKVFMCCILITASALSFGGYYLVSKMFESSLEREIKQTLDEIGLLAFAFETAALSIPEKYGQLQDKTVTEIASTLGRNLRISAEDFTVLYASSEFSADNDILAETAENVKAYRITLSNGSYHIQSAIALSVNDKRIYMETLRDITPAFTQRDDNFSLYRRVSAIILIFEAVVIYMVSIYLTRPIKQLSRASKSMASGDYGRRAKKMSNDELGSLTDDFNKMSAALEEKILKLQEEARIREDFVAAFAHELKTPLTAIIGYADLLRLKKLDEERHFLSADYIYREGRRLESLSLRLLDLIVLKRTSLSTGPVDAADIFERLKYTFSSAGDLLNIDYDNGKIEGEAPLLVTVLQNLVDNALKASDGASPVYVKGEYLKDKGVYVFRVEDTGRGINNDEIDKITEAFYMVDKSRSRNRNGAGLGLSLCAEILSLHGSKLKIESAQDVGTCVSFGIKTFNEEPWKDKKS